MSVFCKFSWTRQTVAWLSVAPALLALSATPSKARSIVSTVNTPIYFEAGSAAEFRGRTPQGVFQITPGEALVTIKQGSAQPQTRPGDAAARLRSREVLVHSVKFSLLNANAEARIGGLDELPGRVNYLIGNDPAGWRTALPTYTRVKVEAAYPGIDLIYYGNQERLEYDFVVAAGANPEPIAFQISGADSVTINPQGDLLLQVGGDELRQHRPVVYQEIDGQRRAVPAEFVLRPNQTVAFNIGAYDHKLPLVIDPVLSYARLVGGKDTDTGWGLAMDAAGSIFVAGETLSAQLPSTSGAFQPSYGGGYPGAGGDAFVAKFNNSGVLQYLTYLGGSDNDAALAIAVDADGSAYLTGITDSTNFPMVAAMDNKIGGTNSVYINLHPFDAFVSKLNPAGSALVYSTYLGGDQEDQGIGIAVDTNRCAYVTGFTLSTNFPVFNALQATNAGLDDLFVSKLNPAGSAFLYSTYLGGAYDDHGFDIAVDAAGRPSLTGYTASTNYPITSTAFQGELSGFQDAFLTVLESNGQSVNYSTFLGGAGEDLGYSLTLDDGGNALVTGTQNGAGFPVSPSKVNTGGFYTSANSGASWSLSSDGLFYNQIDAILADAQSPNTLYVGNYRGLFRSVNGGATWSSIFPHPRLFTAIAQDPVDPAILYAGQTYLYRSTNSGVTWSQNSTGLTAAGLSAIIVDPLRRTNIYAATLNGVYRSTNAANTWVRSSAGLRDIHVTDLAINPLNPSNLFAVTWDGVYRSTNAAANWQSIRPNFTNFQALKIAVDPANPARLFIAGDGSVGRTLDSGSNWTRLSVGSAVSNILALALDPTDASTIYVGSSAGVHRSTDAGDTWTLVSTGLSEKPIQALAVNPHNPALVYAGTLTSRCFGTDVFLTKFGPAGFSLVFGGCGVDTGWGVAVDGSGIPIVVGATASTDFPVRSAAGSLSATNNGRQDVFLTAFAPDGSDYLYSVYLGGRLDDFGIGVVADPAGNAYIIGETSSANFPTNGFAAALAGESDMFIAKISADPVLTATAEGSKLNLQWRAFSPEYRLQGNHDVQGAPAWADVSPAPILTNGWHRVQIDRTNPASLFRLRGANPTY
jgi:photosystem II stability/assembly factor-like uncharacterized protein